MCNNMGVKGMKQLIHTINCEFTKELKNFPFS
nr:MAG TPA: hypothetical protein [Caudoviricetes sp.]